MYWRLSLQSPNHLRPVVNPAYIQSMFDTSNILTIITQQSVEFLLTWIELITTWLSIQMHSAVLYEITYPFPNFKVYTFWSLGMDKDFHPTLYNGCNYLSMLGLMFIHVSKTGPCEIRIFDITYNRNPHCVAMAYCFLILSISGNIIYSAKYTWTSLQTTSLMQYPVLSNNCAILSIGIDIFVEVRFVI